MRKFIPSRDLPDPIPEEVAKKLLWTLEGRVIDAVDSVKKSQKNKVRDLNRAVESTFRENGLIIEYAGPYGILKERPDVSNPLFEEVAIYRKDKGCHNIDLNYGIIGIGARNCESVYAPSVLDVEDNNPDEHHECRKTNQGEIRSDMSELVIVLPKVWIDSDGKEHVVAQEFYDTDIVRPNVFSERAAKEYERVILIGMKECFPDPIAYNPKEGLHYKPPKISEESCPI